MMKMLASYAGPAPGDFRYFMWEINSVPWHGKLGFALIVFATVALMVCSMKNRVHASCFENAKVQFNILIRINLIWAAFLTIENTGHMLLRNLQANSAPLAKLYLTLDSFLEVSAPIAMGLVVWILILICLFWLARVGE